MYLQNANILEISKKEKQENGDIQDAFLITRKPLARCPEPQKALPDSHQCPCQGSGSLWLHSVGDRLGPVSTGPRFLKHIFFCSLLDSPPCPRPRKPHGGEIVSLFVLVD